MPRVRFRRVASQSSAIVGAVALLLTVVPSTVAEGASTSPSAPTTRSTASTSTGQTKQPTVTFGIGPSNGKALDGRALFSYLSAPGATISDHFAVVNISAQPLSLLIYGTDGTEGSGGALSFLPRGAQHAGASAWLALPEVNGSPIFRVPPRSTVNLPFQVRVPSNATPGDHTAGIAVGLIANVVGASAKDLKLEQRVVVQVHLRLSGTLVAKLAIEHLSASYHGTLNPFGSGSVTVSYTVHNVGNVDLGGRQRITLDGLFGSDGMVAAPPMITDLLPGDSTRVSVRVRGVWPLFLLKGTVHVTPLGLQGAVDPRSTVVSASTTVWAIPWALLALIVLIVIIGVLLRWYAKRRAARRAAPKRRRERGKDDPTLSAMVAANRARSSTPDEGESDTADE